MVVITGYNNGWDETPPISRNWTPKLLKWGLMYHTYMLLASEWDTIRGYHFEVCDTYIYIYVYVCVYGRT